MSDKNILIAEVTKNFSCLDYDVIAGLCYVCWRNRTKKPSELDDLRGEFVKKLMLMDFNKVKTLYSMAEKI